VSAADSGRSTAEPIALRERASATPLSPERRARVRGEGEGEGETSALVAEGAPSPKALADQQAWFARAVMTPESEESPVGAALVTSILTPGPLLNPLGRLEIYRRAYHLRLIECLLDDYPAVAATVGEEAFEELCRKYIAIRPSTDASLNSYGRHMSNLCRAELQGPFAPVRAPSGDLSFVADLAALEWAVVEVIHAATAEPLTMTGLASMPASRWADARLVATPALRMLRFGYPINRYFQAFREGSRPAVPSPAASSVVVYRSGPTIWRMDLGEAAFDLLHALTSGQSLAASLDGASAALAGVDESEAAAQVTVWFRDWVSSGLFSSVEFA
jgi:Putative DNA-binding domain